MELRLNKFISESGYCSRREADRFIAMRNVTVNGRVASIGTKISRKDVIMVNGNLIEQPESHVYLVLNKPIGITCTTDKMDGTNVIDYVNYPTRIFHIGRLDKDSEGLLMLTNDGDIVNKILRSKNKHEKEYEVTVDKPIDDTFVEKMQNGIPILGVMTKKCKVEKESSDRFKITITQGLNRQIRRMCEHLGYEVLKLKRVRIMNITLKSMEVGQWRDLTETELEMLLGSVKKSKSEAPDATLSAVRAGKTGSKVPKKIWHANKPTGRPAGGGGGSRPASGGSGPRPARGGKPGAAKSSAPRIGKSKQK